MGRAIALFCAAFCATGVAAQDGVILRDLSPADVSDLQTGQQLLVRDHDGNFVFAGRSVQAAGFTGVAGYSSETAYIAVISGAISLDGLRVPPGRMLLLPPLGAGPIVERFDAARFADSWPQPAREAAADSYADLTALGKAQQRGITLGRLGRTSLNVAAPGSAERELAARTIKGGDAVRAIRFSPAADAEQIERSIAQTFVDALATADAAAVAALLDPVPYGNTDLRNGAAEARRAFAEDLLAQRDWASLLAGASVTRGAESTEWRINTPATSGVIRLRPMGDFAFVRAIEMGAR